MLRALSLAVSAVKHRKLELAHLQTLGIGVENDKGMVRFGSIAAVRTSTGHFRSASNNGHQQTGQAGPFRAISNLLSTNWLRPGANQQSNKRCNNDP